MPFCVKCGAPGISNQNAFCGNCGTSTSVVPTETQGAGPNTSASFHEQPPVIATPGQKKALARKWVNGYTLAGGGIAAAAIIPGTTSAALFTLETTMVLHIGRIYRGSQFSKEDAVAVVGAAGFMGTVGVGSKMAMEGLNFFPVVGWAIKGGIAGSVIKTLGEAIIKYFESIEHHK